MNNQEYEQKKRECLLDFCREHGYKITPDVEGIFGYAFDRAYTLGKQEKEAEPPKFKKGDRVKTKYNDEYTISAVEPITDKYMYSLVCDNKTWCGMHLESKLRKVDNK